jgi:SAM-dependent methyltransferase
MLQNVTLDAISMAYRLILGREPENEAVLQSGLKYRSFEAMRTAFLNSDEFRRKLAWRPPLVPLDAAPNEVEWQVDDTVAEALLAHVGATWTRLGQERPHWSVLSTDRFAPERIEATRATFYQSGTRDRDMLLAVLKRLGLEPASFPRLFEFGCGVARVTPFLAESFAEVVACDVSSSHIALARTRLAETDAGNVVVQLATAQDFGMTGGFDLWFSRLVLQHNPPPVMAMVLRRALGLLNPGGIAHFQVPTYARNYRFNVADYMAGLEAADGNIEMHVLPQQVIFEIAAQCGCEALEVWQDASAGNSQAWVSSVVTLRKRGTPRRLKQI